MPEPTRLTTFTNDGYTFDVRDEGPLDGPPIVLLHGFPDGPASWDRVVPLLVEAGRRVLVPAQRGYSPGARPPRAAEYRIDALGADIVALLDQAGIDRADIVGHDWGGGVAWQLAAEHADRVRTLSVFSTPHPRAMVAAMTHSTQGLRSWYMGFFQLPKVPEANFRLGGGKLFARNLRKMGLPAAEAEAATARILEPGAATGALNWYRAVQPRRLREMRDIDVPTMYVWSTDDAALGRYAAEHTGDHVTGPYRFEVLPGVSHWIPTEVPQQVVDLLLEHTA